MNGGIIMSLDKLRYLLTNHTEKLFFTYENYKLLVHPSVTQYRNLLNRIDDDIEMMPKVDQTLDHTDIKFYRLDYNENIYSKNELLVFIYASINEEWNVIRGTDICTGKNHFWLKSNRVIFDPALAIITNESTYSKRFKQSKEIKNENIHTYLAENNNLYKFYDKRIFKRFRRNGNPSFSIDFINGIMKEFNENIRKEYLLDENRIQHIRQYFMLDDFMELRQVLSQNRKSYLQSNKIAVHPSINNAILESIETSTKNIYDLMLQEYDMEFDYHNETLGNCYGLSILFNLYDKEFKLVQGGTVSYTPLALPTNREV